MQSIYAARCQFKIKKNKSNSVVVEIFSKHIRGKQIRDYSQRLCRFVSSFLSYFMQLYSKVQQYIELARLNRRLLKAPNYPTKVGWKQVSHFIGWADGLAVSPLHLTQK